MDNEVNVDVSVEESDGGENNDDLSTREREMQIVPFVVRPKNSNEEGPKDENSLVLQ